MYQQRLYEKIFRASSFLTDLLPRTGAWFLNMIVLGLFGNQLLTDACLARDIEILMQRKQFDRILVIGDLNIGDAVNLQASISALRNFFPDAAIDYAINRTAACLVEGNPDISTLWTVFSGTPCPSENDLRAIQEIISENRYSVIFNFCPFFNEKDLLSKHNSVIDYRALAITLMRNEKILTSKNHVAYQAYQFIHNLLSSFLNPAREKSFTGVDVTLSDSAIERARCFSQSNGLFRANSLLLYNPDASSPFTRMPFELQVSILKRLIQLPCTILLGSGHTLPNIERRLLNSLPLSHRRKVIIIPHSTPLDVYAVLIDFSEVFVTGDTGLLHVGAARKRSRYNGHKFRNRTAILSVFGATPARIYGYDSVLPGFVATNQDAPSRCYISDSACRNITCINKRVKTCKTVRCFRDLNIERIEWDVRSYMSILKTEAPREGVKQRVLGWRASRARL